MRKVRYKTLRVDMGGVWVSLLLLLYLAPGAPGLGDQSRPVTLHQLSLVPGLPPADAPVGMASLMPEAWRVRRSRVRGVRRSRRRTRSQYREDPEPEDYEEDEGEGSANQVDGEDEEDAPEEDRLLLEQHISVEEDDDDEAPPDSAEMRERYRVSDHENPPEPPTRPNYTGEGEWARPPPHVAGRMPFVPVQNYAQVRRYETKLHLSPEDALSDAANQEEAENAPRLREVVTHHRTQQVYSEEGYEDSAYDHGGYDKHGEHHELAPGWEMTAVRLLGRAAESATNGGSAEEGGGEGDEEEDDDTDDHNAEGSDPRAKAVAAPDANRTLHGTTNETRGTWRFQKVTTDNKNKIRVAEASGNFSKPMPLTPLETLVTLAKSKRDSDRKPKNSTLRTMPREQHHVEKLLRALKLKEKERRLAQKRSKKWGREKKKNRLSRKLKKERTLSKDGFDIRDNEINQPRSSKAKKLRKEQKRAKRFKASKMAVSLFGEGTHVFSSPVRAIIPSSIVQDVKEAAHSTQMRNVTNKTNAGLLYQAADAVSKRTKPLSVMNSPFSMYHRDPTEETAPLVDFSRDKLDRVLSPSSVGDVAHSKIWGLVPPWGSYGNGKQLPSLQPDSLFRPLPTGLLASADSEEAAGNDGLATVIQPVRSNMEGFFDSTGRIGAWDAVRERRTEGTLETSTTTEKPRSKFVLPGQGNAARKFPKTEAILQMETRTLSKLRKTHNVKELPSNLKHVKPLIGVSSSKSGKLSAKQIKMKNIGKRPLAHLGKDFTALKRYSVIPTMESFMQSSTEQGIVTTDRAVYIANLTENHLTAKNFSWPPQVTLPISPETMMPLRLSHVENKAVKLPVENMPHRKTRRNVKYQFKAKPFENGSRGTLKFKRDSKPFSSKMFSGVRIDEHKYPFYFASSSENLPKYSPLRYAMNPGEIPVKTGGGMEFYESREKYKICKEVEPPEDPVPDRPGDGQWVQNTDGPDGPRISGLGEVISCLREKLFGKDPLDNPFFLETKAGLPAYTSLVGVTADEDGTPQATDHFDFYKDIMRQIDKTALRPFQADVPDSPYVYIGSKSTSDSEEAQRSPERYAAPRLHHFNINAKKPEKEYFGNVRHTAKEILAAELAPQDVSDNDKETEGRDSLEKTHMTGVPLQEPPVNQQYFNPPVSVHDTIIDPHKPLQLSEVSKKYLDEVLDNLANQKDLREEFMGDGSQTDAQETKMLTAHSDSIYQPVKATTMHPPPLTTLKYKSKYRPTDSPSINLGPNSHERLLSWPKAKNVLRDVGEKQEMFESSESKDPLRSQSESDNGKAFYEQKKISSGEALVHSASFNFNQTLFGQKDDPVSHSISSKTDEIAKQIEDAIKEHLPKMQGIQATTTENPGEEFMNKDVHEPSASVITPLSTSHSPRLPEPIYHAVRGVGGIKAYHVGMQDDSVIEIPTAKPQGDKWRYKPAEHSEGTELSAQQSDEREQQASNEPEPHEEQATGSDAPDDNQEDDDNAKNDGNASDQNNDDNNESANNEHDADHKNDDKSANDDDKSATEDDKGATDDDKDATDDDKNGTDDDKNGTDDDKKATDDDKNATDDDKNATDDDKNATDDKKDYDNTSDTNKNDENDDDDKHVEDDDAKADNNEEAPENNEEEEDKSNNNGKPDFDDWFKESPYKVNDENDYNLDLDDSRPKFRVPFSKEWHKELGGINDEFKDDKDEDDEVGKHVEKLFDDDKGHDAYPDINTEPPAAASGEGEPGDGNKAENQEVSQQDPQEEAEDQNAPSEEDNAANSEKENKNKASATEEVNDDTKEDPKEDEDGSNAAEENISPEEDNHKTKKQESAEPTSNEEPASAEEPKKWESSGSTRHAKKKPKDESAQETDVPSQESGGTGNDDGYDPAGYEKPDEHSPSGEAQSTEESQQSPKKAKAVDAFWSDKDDFGAPPGAKIRVVEHDASFGDMDDDDDDDDTTSHGGKKITRRGKTPDNLSITTTNSQVRSKGFDTGVNKRRAISHQNKARPVIENVSTTSSGEDMDGDFATNPKIIIKPPIYGNTEYKTLNTTTDQKTTVVK